ncbi:MAG: hypothetical protein MUW56_19755 [Chryseobacterium sp.]|uniref:hypothetical protein n=1 Tax=Chryseobacterium sp. TaxID=1871047 RepID=UPI0025BDCF88|nr:hypothetical protein [Chryseobacterium sp.]MCJ7935796.1 hypothetical protein [Chryseobacterium sp.]
MQIKLIIFITSLFSILSFGQTKEVNYESEVKTDFTTFFENIKEKDIDNAVNFIYPKYLAAITREQMFKILNLSYNNPAFMTDIQRFKVDQVEKPELIGKEYFSVTHYSFTMKFKVDWKVIHDAELVKEKMNEAVISSYGKDNVTYFNNGDYYIINAHKKACAVSTDQKDWKFLIIEKEYRPELVNILPEKILEKF